ncbi:hypothetical protein [Rhodovulum sp. P5]|uniref:hypothetical protein n=1 Tax=Rhodovulum sp. P5 TaxID=1564506 RepID=UPI0012EBD731|nr:hypothetical protein [Rhodovulum sp. P5]
MTTDKDRIAFATLAHADLTQTPLRRDHFVPAQARDDAYHAAYDRTTLWYDAFWRDGRVVLVAPRLLNFWPALKAADIRLDGVPAKLGRRARFHRHEVLHIPARQRPKTISVTGPDWSLETDLSISALDRFAGRNVILTISKDNDLDWIRDFARFHQRTQRAEAILFIDNGSSAYGPDDIAAVLADAGLSGTILSAPLPYGPVVQDKRNRHRANFFRTAMLNLARLRFLSRARAVLNVDIDELVWTDGPSIFDIAANARFGFAPFGGAWRHPPDDLDRAPRHADHVWAQEASPKTPAKYAVAPNRLAGRFSWDVHRLEGLPLKSAFLREDAGYWHCSCISTGWKYTQRLTHRGGDRIDPRCVQAFQSALPG